MSLELYLVRHGETVWNTAGRFQGQMSSLLTCRGREQAHENGQLLASVLGKRRNVPLHVSPLGRCRETAAIIRHYADYADPIFEPRIQEVTVGSWDGLTHAEIDAGWPGRLDGCTRFDWFFRAPDGESYADALARVLSWLRESNGIVVAVSHGLIGRLIRGAYLGLAREETLSLPVSQDVVWHVRDRRIEVVDARPWRDSGVAG
jgi:broad specificity phosphatase PhoE